MCRWVDLLYLMFLYNYLRFSKCYIEYVNCPFAGRRGRVFLGTMENCFTRSYTDVNECVAVNKSILKYRKFTQLIAPIIYHNYFNGTKYRRFKCITLLYRVWNPCVPRLYFPLNGIQTFSIPSLSLWLCTHSTLYSNISQSS